MNADILTIILVFAAGFFCLLTTKNIVRLVIGIEIMARAATFAFIYFGYLHNNTAIAQSAVVTIIVVEAAVSAIALALIMNLYKQGKTLDIKKLNKLKG